MPSMSPGEGAESVCQIVNDIARKPVVQAVGTKRSGWPRGDFAPQHRHCVWPADRARDRRVPPRPSF